MHSVYEIHHMRCQLIHHDYSPLAVVKLVGSLRNCRPAWSPKNSQPKTDCAIALLAGLADLTINVYDQIYCNFNSNGLNRHEGSMMNVSDFRLLYEYQYWATYKMIVKADRLEPGQFTMPTAFPWGSLRDTLVHMLNSERGWLSILRNGVVIYEDGELPPTDFATVIALKEAWDGIEYDWHTYLRDLTEDSLQSIISYEVEGNTRNRHLWHCLFHVVNHGTQHRSECAAILTDFGQSPGDYDFTLFSLTRGA